MSGQGKLYRFPPTRGLGVNYDSVVPPSRRRGVRVRELEDYFSRREEEIIAKDGETEREYPLVLPPVETLAVEYGEGSQDSWMERVEGKLLRKIASLRRALYLARKEEEEAENGLKILMQSARESASGSAAVLSHHMTGVFKLEEVVTSDTVHCTMSTCSRRALPYSRFCLLHMSSDQDQVLYGSCAVSEPGSGVCGTTVPDILLNTPLCSKHITKSALETSVQQQKRKTAASGTTSRPNKTTKTKGQKTKKKAPTTAVTKLVVTKSSLAVTTTPAAVGVAVLSSTSSWSSGESDGEKHSETKRPKLSTKSHQTTPAAAKESDQLPSLAPEATLDLSLTASIPSLILPPPLPDIGKFMDDSSSEDS